jgi:hypothetical protein
VIAQLPLLKFYPPNRRTSLEVVNGAWQLFQWRVEGYTAKYAALWEAVEATTPRLGPDIPSSQKLERESRATREFERIKTRLRQIPRLREQREVWRQDLLNTARELAGSMLDLPNAGLKLLFTQEGMEATRRFVHDAKAFDSGMDDDSLLQALRNLWVIHSIQLLLDQEVSLSLAIFAYSMLYPWTDNYLDDPQIPSESKVEFGEWLEQRLCGSRVAPPGLHAAQVGRLVALIEEDFPRAEFEEVYLSLRAIHQAQTASLEQQVADDRLDEQKLLQITMSKGGTSVLADAWLVAGQLTEPEADFMFGYGILLQLLDDLQDVRSDLADGNATVFTRQAADGLLDELASRLWSFTQAVLWSSSRFEAPRFQPIKALIQENCKLLLLQAVAGNCGFYTTRFAAELETCSPWNFSFLRVRGAKLQSECKSIIALLRRERRIDSAFDLLD